MSIKVESTTDTPEDVIAATGGLSDAKTETKVESKKESASEKTDEKELSESETDTSEVDETDDNDGDEESQDQENKPKKKKSGFKKRIDKLNTRLSEREKELAYWREQAMSKAPTQAKEQVEKKAESSDEPNPDDFETVRDYTKAVTRWEIAQEKKILKEQELKSKQQKEIDDHNKRVDAFAKDVEDFWDVIDEVDDIKASEPLEQIILESENGPALMYEIARDRQLFERLNVLGERQLAREIGKIEARLSTSQDSTQTEIKKITKTPAPLKTVGTKSSGASTKSPDEMDFHEYKKWRAANS